MLLLPKAVDGDPNSRERSPGACGELAILSDNRRIPRREFVKLSGALGAAVLAVPVAGASTAGAARHRVSLPNLCGDPSDKGPELWTKASKCWSAHHNHQTPDPALGCRGTMNDHVVFNGATVKQSYLLVATDRRKGIECPKIWASGAPNYWIAAWRQAQPGGAGPVAAPIGLGINSAKQRSQDQLHIHMATLLAGVRPQLQELEKHGEITNDPAKWDQSVVQVKGLEEHPAGHPVSDPRAYRALRVPNLKRNLFALLNQYVPAARQDMSIQMMAVTARMDPQTKMQDGFYVLNSDPNLKGPTHGVGGISACDQLFNWG